MARWEGPLVKLDDYRWEIPASYKAGMRVPGLVYADEALLGSILEDQAMEQVANVATLPGIVGHSLAMPDIHWGYGFPIGGVAATRTSDGVISPGGVGFDINCGVRLIRTSLFEEAVRPHIKELVASLYQAIPAGLGSEGRVRLKGNEMDRVLLKGARWAVEQGYGEAADLECAESGGVIGGADPGLVSQHAKERGAPQLGTLGAGNHFLEVQAVDEVYAPEVAPSLGIEGVGQVMVMVHTGSRGLGHQVCDDFLGVMDQAARKYGIELPDRQLACAPVPSREGQDYLAAMRAAANFAWANRQLITHWMRDAFVRVLRLPPRELGLALVYDVAHNIAKIERHRASGRELELCVHRKGATRSFPPGHPEVPARYREVGQPVLIPGDMGRYSYVAVGTERALAESWGSTCHGAGRVASRHAAKRQLRGVNIVEQLARKGITVMARSPGLLAEEASIAYKDVREVVNAADGAGLCKKVARLRPIGVIKG